jgi:hypothetical protein
MPARMLEMPAQFEINTGHDLIDAGFDYCNLSVDDSEQIQVSTAGEGKVLGCVRDA